jgi:hypothetical protein
MTGHNLDYFDQENKSGIRRQLVKNLLKVGGGSKGLKTHGRN